MTPARQLLLLAFALAAFGCNQLSEPPPEPTGMVTLSITNAPPDASCLRITVRGATTAVRSRALMTGQSTIFVLEGLPVGQVEFIGEAFALVCGMVTPESTATYVSEAVTATLVGGQPVNIALALRQPARATVSVDFPDGGAPGRPVGEPCTANGECSSGSCVDGVCCNGPCGACQICNSMAARGTCTNVPAGQDPRNDCAADMPASCGRTGTCNGSGACALHASGTQCAPPSCMGSTQFSARVCDGAGSCLAPASMSCAPNVCMGGSCGTSCTSSADCQMGFLCSEGRCVAGGGLGTSCTSSSSCASGFCVDGVCCASACNGTCQSCAVPGSLGMCGSAPAGQDARNDCPADAPSTCGRTGTCNGSGACAVHSAGTLCAPASCTNGNATADSTCNGFGMCVTGATQSCGPFRCSGVGCGTTCASAADCAAGAFCSGGACVSSGGPALHWKFDEAMGTTALDSSGNSFAGTYVGTTLTPTPSTNVPTALPGNLRSRAFVRANQHAVRLSPSPAVLRPTNDLTVSAWYRATSTDTSGAELVSGGNSYIVRLRPTQIEFAKRIPSGTGGTFVQCAGSTSGHLNGAWHHVAAVTTATGMTLYLDGAIICSNTRGENVRYDQGTELWVGRHGVGQTVWDFEGNADDVRIYTRALTPSEIMSLATGAL